MKTSHRVILAGVAGAAFLGPFTQTVYTPNLPELQRFFDVNTVLINLTISLFTAILAASNFIVGPLADTLGRRAVLLPGLLLFSGGSLLCLASDSYAWFLTGRALQASGITTALLVAPTVIGDTYAPRCAPPRDERLPDRHVPWTCLRSPRRRSDRDVVYLAVGFRAARCRRSRGMGVLFAMYLLYNMGRYSVPIGER